MTLALRGMQSLQVGETLQTLCGAPDKEDVPNDTKHLIPVAGDCRSDGDSPGTVAFVSIR